MESGCAAAAGCAFITSSIAGT
eukprot:COSAG05_NODE_19147_length_297_cov_0.570707_1_plen_21_part_01